MTDKIKIKEVSGMVLNRLLTENDSIENDFDIEMMAAVIKDINVYWRNKEECPFRRGNLVVDLILDNDQIFCIKLPYETSRPEIDRYLTPLLQLLEKHYGNLQHINLKH